MKIMHILPELEEGGVERIVPMLANEESRLGHEVYVVSNGGRLESQLSLKVKDIIMPVHRKNPSVALMCAIRLAKLIGDENISIIHAHSRVPAWICHIVRLFSRRVRYIFTAHATYHKLNYGTWPITRADGITCVSNSVMKSLKSWVPKRVPSEVIYNPRGENVLPWEGSGDPTTKHLLYLGRISVNKGPIFAVEALAKTSNENWVLDVVGNGPAMGALRAKIRKLGIEGHVKIHGFSNTPSEAISRCDLFLCPSLDEGFSLALMEALSAGAPALASDIPAVRELTSEFGENPNGELLSMRDTAAWAETIDRFLAGKFVPTLKLMIKLPAAEEMALDMLAFYEKILAR
jgi:glycosyltransferase involved in cell wall biosynthesis